MGESHIFKSFLKISFKEFQWECCPFSVWVQQNKQQVYRYLTCPGQDTTQSFLRSVAYAWVQNKAVWKLSYVRFTNIDRNCLQWLESWNLSRLTKIKFSVSQWILFDVSRGTSIQGNFDLYGKRNLTHDRNTMYFKTAQSIKIFRHFEPALETRAKLNVTYLRFEDSWYSLINNVDTCLIIVRLKQTKISKQFKQYRVINTNWQGIVSQLGHFIGNT